jgi:integrase
MAKRNPNHPIKGLHTKRGWYYFQASTPKDGSPRPVAVALGTKDLVEAIGKAEQARADLLAWQAAKRNTFDEMLPRYLREKAEDSPKTRTQREMVLRSFSRILGNPRLADITAAMIDEWRAHVSEHGIWLAGERSGMAKNGRAKRGKIEGPRSSTTVKTYTIVVKAFFNWAVDRGLIEQSPVRRLKRQTLVVRTRVQEFLTEAHREILLKAEAPEGIRFILHFGFFQGLRDSEMLAMTADWLWIAPDWNSGTVTVKEQEIIYQNGNKGWWKPKTREMRTIPLHPRVLEFLKSYGMRRPWMLRPENERWPNPGMQSKRYDAHKTMERLGKKAGVPKLNYHILRHSFATHLVMKGVTLADVAGLLGDTLSVTEKNYAGYSPSLANPLSVL